MSASDEVAGLPGGQAIAALAAQVKGNPAAIRDIAGSWAEAAGDCSAHADTVRRAVSEVSHDWQGSSATAFAAFMRRFARASRGVQHALRAGATTLRGAAESLEDAQRSVEGICENLLGEVSRLRAASPKATSSDLDKPISGLVAEAAGEVRTKVAEARHALEQADGALGREVSRLNRAFSSLPQAGSLGFGSAWGKPAGWRSALIGQGTGSTSGRASGADGGEASGAGGGEAPGSGGAEAWASSGGEASGTGGGEASGTGGGEASGTGSQATLTAYSGGTPSHQAPGSPSPVYAGAGAATGGAALVPPPGGGPAPPAQVKQWINHAVKILETQGIPASKLSPQDIWIIIQHESGGDPTAVNDWDSNAAAGDPSRGLMQCIGTTFNAYALPGHHDIFNPVDNIIAGVRYALARYGALGNVPGVVAVHNGEPYVGY